MRPTFLFAVGAAFVISFAGCMTAIGEPGEDLAQAEDEISALLPSYVTVRPDLRRCAAPLCGGYFVRDVNNGERVYYVSELVFPRTLFDAETIEEALEAPGDMILRGVLGVAEPRFETRPFVVREAFRGMPGHAPRTGDRFFTVEERKRPIMCLVAPCNNEIAVELNTRVRRDFTRFSVNGAASRWVDREWLASRVDDHGALVAGVFVPGEKFPGGYEKVLAAHQIYVRLPDVMGPCPSTPVAMCPTHEVATFSRSEDRCLVFEGCERLVATCPPLAPVCAEGYTLASWRSEPYGCMDYACDPTFVTP
jgi:hypothetical protein